MRTSARGRRGSGPREERASRFRAGAAALSLVLLLVGCQTTSEPERRDIFGSWRSEDVPGVVIRMTLASTTRSVDGAGIWEATTGAHAFRVTGAFAEDEVSLYLDFDGRDDLNFQGAFSDDDLIEGTLAGVGFAPLAIVLTRVDLRP